MTSATLPRETVDAARRRWWWPLLAILAVVALLVVMHLAATPTRTVGRISFVNGGAYDVEVSVAGAGDTGTLALGTARARSTTDVNDVVDQWPDWVVHFGAQGVDGGALRISRADLKQGDWRVVIPVSVAARFANAGLQPSPVPTN
jgi:hypothetical protein